MSTFKKNSDNVEATLTSFGLVQEEITKREQELEDLNKISTEKEQKSKGNDQA